MCRRRKKNFRVRDEMKAGKKIPSQRVKIFWVFSLSDCWNEKKLKGIFAWIFNLHNRQHHHRDLVRRHLDYCELFKVLFELLTGIFGSNLDNFCGHKFCVKWPKIIVELPKVVFPSVFSKYFPSVMEKLPATIIISVAYVFQ